MAILVATGYHKHELLFPYYRLKEAGAVVTVAGPESGEIVYGEGRHGMDGLPFTTDAAIRDLNARDLDAAEEAIQYGPLVTSVYFGYLPQYMKTFLRAVAER